MAGFRRRVRAIAIATAGAQVLVLALALATVCGAVEHTHGGQPAHDCPMHHQQGVPTPTAHHHHHGSEPSSDGPRMTCGCPGDILAAILSQSGIIMASIDVSPSTDAMSVPTANPQSIVDLIPGPLAPPPRA